MNLLLFDPAELTGDTLTLADRRAHHLRTVLGVRIGDSIRAGELGGRTGSAQIVADDGSAYTLRIALDGPPSRPLDIDLVLAVPRPKVITRTLEIAASFAVRSDRPHERMEASTRRICARRASIRRRSRSPRGSAPSKARRRTSRRSPCTIA